MRINAEEMSKNKGGKRNSHSVAVSFPSHAYTVCFEFQSDIKIDRTFAVTQLFQVDKSTGRQIPGAEQPCNSNLRHEGTGSAGSNINENGSFG